VGAADKRAFLSAGDRRSATAGEPANWQRHRTACWLPAFSPALMLAFSIQSRLSSALFCAQEQKGRDSANKVGILLLLKR
jgi:hypothetical protein